MFPDVTALLIAYLDPRLTPPVASAVPNPRPDRFVQVRRVGGSTATVRDTARVDVISWAPTEPDAMSAALSARADVWALAGTNTLGVACYAVTEFMGPRQQTDELTGQPSAWITFEVTVRADLAIHPAPTV